MNLEFAKKIKNFCYIAASLIAAASFLFKSRSMLLLITAVVIMLIGIAISVAFYRCPNCKKPLPTNEGIPQKCPNCGEPLR